MTHAEMFALFSLGLVCGVVMSAIAQPFLILGIVLVVASIAPIRDFLRT